MKAVLLKLYRYIKKYSIQIAAIIVFIVYFALSFKDPFSVRSLIPNLEPFPDTLFYSIPAINFIKGNEFKMMTYGHEIKSMVPPLYSIFLIPFYFIKNDFRMFYFANQALGFFSLFLFIKIISTFSKKRINKSLYILSGGLIYATTFHIYNLPSLLMAENLTLTLVMLSFYLLATKNSKINSIFSGYVGLLLLLTKFSNLPLALAFHLSFLIKVILNNKVNVLSTYLINSIISVMIFVFFVLKTNILFGHANLSSETSFNIESFKTNLNFYVNGLMGSNARFLWYQELLFNKFFAVTGVIGLIWSYLNNNKRNLISYFGIFIALNIGFMSFFYYADSRYIMTLVIPLILGFVLFLNQFAKIKSAGKSSAIAFFIILFSLLITKQGPHLNVNNLISLKNQIMINFKYQETPWNYLAVQNFNDNINESNSYLATFLPPFYIEINSFGKYNYLPISLYQEFSSSEKDVLKYFYNKSLIDEYLNLMNDGKNIYISNYYASTDVWKKDYQNIEDIFETELVSEGCFGSCNLYKLSIKNEN
ncbi:MAG: hypothetical protein H6772_00490 [Pseudomonadales bacterium]|nr:hypothetical protein [Pseudomonadales bacterium]